jgi:hypothetical protein
MRVDFQVGLRADGVENKSPGHSGSHTVLTDDLLTACPKLEPQQKKGGKNISQRKLREF